jgi:conjugal transfer pilus assembly protein TraK
MQRLHKTLTTVAAALLVGAALPASALQVLEGAVGKKHLVRIPARELTRLSIEDGRLQSMRYLAEELEVQQDKESGSVYLKPRSEDKQVSVFVVSASGATHELILQPVASMPLESVVIRDPAPVRSRSTPGGAGKSAESKSSALDQTLKRLALVMARGETAGTDTSFERVNVPMALWDEASFTLVGRFRTRSHVGESYSLVNTSDKVLQLAEQEFFRSGVIAISIDQHVLRPGESTAVYVIRGADDE